MTDLRRWCGLLVALALVLATAGCRLLAPDRIEVVAELRDTAGLFVGNDVGVLGVQVGEVTAITPRGDVVEVTLAIDADVAVPAEAGAVVVARSVATDRYVELTPVYDGGPAMEAGDRIPVERTRTPVEFDELLASLGAFSEGLAGPDGEALALRRLLRAGARHLDGEQLGETVRDAAAAAGTLSGHREELTGAIGELDRLTAVLADNQQVVDRFIESVGGATDLFADERQAFGRSLRALARALRSLARFARENRARLGSSLPALTRVTEDLLEHRSALEETVEQLPLTFGNIGRAVSEDGRLRVKLPARYLSPAPEVTEPLCEVLPATVCDNLGTAPDFGEVVGAILGGAG